VLALAGCAKCRVISLHRASRANPRCLSIKRRRRCRAHVRAIRSTSNRVSLAFGPPIEIGRLNVDKSPAALPNRRGRRFPPAFVRRSGGGRAIRAGAFARVVF